MSARVKHIVAYPHVSFSDMTTSDAIRHFALSRDSKRKICVLNFANGSAVGGGYKNGATAQEEDLCRSIPNLYTTLNNAQREGYFPFGPCTCAARDRPCKYSDVLWTPDAILARGSDFEGYALLPADQQVPVSLVSAAAPNIRFAKPPELYDRELMYRTVQSVFVAPSLMQPEVTTLILGAWGCGAFGGDPNDISELFCRALATDKLGCLYKEVHFAIPCIGGEHRNSDVFRATFKRHRIDFTEVGSATRVQ